MAPAVLQLYVKYTFDTTVTVRRTVLYNTRSKRGEIMHTYTERHLIIHVRVQYTGYNVLPVD